MDFPLFQDRREGHADDIKLRITSTSMGTGYAEKIGKAGLDQCNPLNLLNPLQMFPGRSLWITSPYPVSMFIECSPPATAPPPAGTGTGTYCATTDIYCTTPVKVQARTKTWLYPHRDLGPVFVNGWNKLSNEIKLHILSQNLRFNNCVSKRSHEEYKMLRHHLRMTPEIAAFSKEVFYSRNSMDLNRFDSSHLLNAEATIPPQAAMPFLNRAQVTVRLGRSHDWPVLFACTRNLREFPTFHHFRIIFQWKKLYAEDLTEDSPKEEWLSALEAEVQPEDVELWCKGEVVFRGYPVLITIDGEYVGAPDSEVLEALETSIKSKISFRR